MAALVMTSTGVQFRDPYALPETAFASMSLDEALAWARPEGWEHVITHEFNDHSDDVRWMAYRRTDPCPTTGARWMVVRIECSPRTLALLHTYHRQDYLARMLSLRMVTLAEGLVELLEALASHARSGRPRLDGWAMLGAMLFDLPHDEEAEAARMLTGLGGLPVLANRYSPT